MATDSTTIFDGDFAKAAAVSPRRFTVPFPDDFSRYVYEQDYAQWHANPTISSLRYSKGALNTPGDAIDGLATVLVEEKNFEMMGANLMKFTRVFAAKPNQRTEWESYAWRRPGTTTSDNPFPVVISAVTQLNGSTQIDTAATSNAVIDHYVIVDYTAAVGGNTQAPQQDRKVRVKVLTTPTTTRFTTEKILDGDAIQYNNVTASNVGRVPTTVTVPSRIIYDYFLTGQGPQDTPENIPIPEAFGILDSEGSDSETLSPTTKPTLTEWNALVVARIFVTVEVTLRRWMGNIFERRIRAVRAQ